MEIIVSEQPQGRGGALAAQQEEAEFNLRNREELGVVTCPQRFAEHVLALKVVYMESVLKNS